MNTLPSGNRGNAPYQYGISHTRTDNNATNNVHGSSNTNFANVLNSYNNTINVGVSEESLRIQAWLSPLEPHARHQDVRNRRLDGVGNWILGKNEFESWRKSQDGSMNPSLLCYGDQGAGKTYINSLVIDTLCGQTDGQNIAVLFLYCDYQARKDQSAANMIGCLLRQIALGAVGTVGEIKNAFEKSRQGGGKGLRLLEMVELFVRTISSCVRVYICVDAIDELVPQHRSEFLRALQQIARQAPNVRLFLTGRAHTRGEVNKHLTKGACAIRIAPHQGDIARYISRKMDDDDDRDPDLMTESLKSDIMKTMLEKASEMFLLVALNIDAILGETSIAERKEMLRKVATTGVDLDNVYDQTLRRLKEQGGGRSRLGMEVLMWVSHAERPLRIDELCHALAVKVGATDLDLENIRPRDTVLGSCLGLVAVDAETSTVRLIHYTLQEYLSRPGVLSGAHSTLGQTCLTYLNYDQIRALPANNISNLGGMPFLEYSSLYWGSHAKIELSDLAKSLALELLSRDGDHISATILLDRVRGYSLRRSTHRLFPGLHCASYFGVDEVVAALIRRKGCDINQRDDMGFTPLMWASEQGNQVSVALLLTRSDVNPNKPDNSGRTPLWWASINGHEGVVRLLLARGDVNPDKSNSDGRTPLWGASFFGHEGVVRLLLARNDINADRPDNDGRTPLWRASRNGHDGVVRLLLARGNVNPNKRDCDGETPLWCASCNDHVRVVRLLLVRDDVNPNKPDNNGRTPLWWACRNGNVEIVRLLLARNDVNPNNSEDDGKVPLWWPSWSGYEDVVRLLLARGDVSPDEPASDGRTPLWAASARGKERVVRLLLARDDVDPDEPGIVGETPLWRASSNGHEGVVRLLLAREDVNPNKPNNRGQTPLEIASDHSHAGIVALLSSMN